MRALGTNPNRHVAAVIAEGPGFAGHGTGVVMDGATVLTCLHVVCPPNQPPPHRVAVRSSAGLEVDARVIATDESFDLALLRLSSQALEDKTPPVWVDRLLAPQHRKVVLRAGGWSVVGLRSPTEDAEETWPASSDLMVGRDLQFSGGLPEGFSGGPLFWSGADQLLCFGVVRLGGARAATSRAVLAHDVLRFLAAHDQQPRTVPIEEAISSARARTRGRGRARATWVAASALAAVILLGLGMLATRTLRQRHAPATHSLDAPPHVSRGVTSRDGGGGPSKAPLPSIVELTARQRPRLRHCAGGDEARAVAYFGSLDGVQRLENGRLRSLPAVHQKIDDLVLLDSSTLIGRSVADIHVWEQEGLRGIRLEGMAMGEQNLAPGDQSVWVALHDRIERVGLDGRMQQSVPRTGFVRSIATDAFDRLWILTDTVEVIDGSGHRHPVDLRQGAGPLLFEQIVAGPSGYVYLTSRGGDVIRTDGKDVAHMKIVVGSPWYLTVDRLAIQRDETLVVASNLGVAWIPFGAGSVSPRFVPRAWSAGASKLVRIAALAVDGAGRAWLSRGGDMFVIDWSGHLDTWPQGSVPAWADGVSAMEVCGVPALPRHLSVATTTLMGQVLAHGRGVGGLKVQACRDPVGGFGLGLLGQDSPCANDRLELSTTTGANGHFEFGSVPIGGLRFAVRKEDGTWFVPLKRFGTKAHPGTTFDVGSVDIGRSEFDFGDP